MLKSELKSSSTVISFDASKVTAWLPSSGEHCELSIEPLCHVDGETSISSTGSRLFALAFMYSAEPIEVLRVKVG